MEHLVSVRQRQSHGLLAKDGLAAGRGVHDHLFMSAGGRDNDHRIHVLVLEQVRMTVIDLDPVQFPAELFAEFGLPVGYCDQPRVGNALCQVARIDAAQPSQSNHAHLQDTGHMRAASG